MPVWITHISHRHGEDYWLFETRERAEREAADWAALWWEKEFGDLPKPADPDEVSREDLGATERLEDERVTEAQIERRVEFMVDELDWHNLTTAMTSDDYNLRMKQIDQWAARALRNSLNLGEG